MKKLFTFPKITIVILLLLFGIGFLTNTLKFDFLNTKPSRYFIETRLSALIKTWRFEDFTDFTEDIDVEQIKQLCDGAQSYFGSCQITDITWKNFSITNKKGPFYTYLVDVDCEKTKAEIWVVLKNTSYDYKIFGIHLVKGE